MDSFSINFMKVSVNDVPMVSVDSCSLRNFLSDSSKNISAEQKLKGLIRILTDTNNALLKNKVVYIYSESDTSLEVVELKKVWSQE